VHISAKQSNDGQTDGQNDQSHNLLQCNVHYVHTWRDNKKYKNITRG